MIQNQENIMERYYRGETTTAEERMLKAAFREGKLPNDPILAYQKQAFPLPEGLQEKIRERIHKRETRPTRQWWIAASGIAAALLLIFSLRMLLPQPVENLCLSDNMKKERFENALKVLGNALQETTPPVQKVVYEDHKLIIAVE